LVPGDSFSGALSRAAGENKGTYAIGQGTLALSSNYDLHYVGADFTITAKSASVTPAAKTKTYGDTDPDLTGTLSGFLTGDKVTAAYSRVAGETVADGPYTISATLSPAGVLGNYNIAYNTADFTITAKPITVTADAAQTKVYGDPEPLSFTYKTNVALVPGDSFSGVLSRAAGENKGTYAIGQGTLALSSNYDLHYVGVDFTITAKPITVTADAAQTKVYGDPEPLSFTYTVPVGSLVGTDSLSGSLSRVANENVGAYAINQGTLGVADTNYAITYVGADFTITARPITVTAVTDTKSYDGTTASTGTPTITSGSLASGDTVTWTQSFDTKNVGTGKTLTPAGTVSDGNGGLNYNITFVNDTTGIITMPAFTESQLSSAVIFRLLLPSSEQLAVYQINTFTGSVYLYHPLTPVDISAFEQFTLTEGDYSFLDGALNLMGHEGLLPFLR
jgi:hypothetical protein